MAADRIEPDVGKAWPQLLGLSEVGKDAVRRRFVADAEARARIAKVLGLESLASLEADLKVSSWLDGVQIGGTWKATVGQICGVTLDPFESQLDGELQIRAVPMGSQALQMDEDHELELDPDADDPPDVLAGDQLDLGAYVVEDLSLAIDPFPRKPGVAFEPPETSAEISPFAVLAKLKGGTPDA
jgi:uncharacterized metal-binding protein YceD (DUF177 family)